jgi:26S proteasome regulatory subunit T6
MSGATSVARPASSSGGGGLESYYQTQLAAARIEIHDRTQDSRRLQAQRNDLNAQVRRLRDELSKLQESGSYIGEVVKVMGKNRVLVKVGSDGKYVVGLSPKIDPALLKPNVRVALRSDSYVLHKILPSKVDPLVSLMRVEAVPDANYVRQHNTLAALPPAQSLSFVAEVSASSFLCTLVLGCCCVFVSCRTWWVVWTVK